MRYRIFAPEEAANTAAMLRAMSRYVRDTDGGRFGPRRAYELAKDELNKSLLRSGSPGEELASWHPHSPLRRLYDRYNRG